MKNLISFLIIIAFAGCCSHPAAITALDRGIAGNSGHMADMRLPQEARDIATDAHDVFQQVRFNLNGTPVSADVQARKDARAAAAAADGVR
jgi:hypothetical protein